MRWFGSCCVTCAVCPWVGRIGDQGRKLRSVSLCSPLWDQYCALLSILLNFFCPVAPFSLTVISVACRGFGECSMLIFTGSDPLVGRLGGATWMFLETAAGLALCWVQKVFWHWPCSQWEEEDLYSLNWVLSHGGWSALLMLMGGGNLCPFLTQICSWCPPPWSPHPLKITVIVRVVSWKVIAFVCGTCYYVFYAP